MPAIYMKHVAPVLLTMALLARALGVEPSTLPSAGQRAAELIGQLGAPDPNTRAHAQESLVRIGLSAKALLEEASKNDDPEIQTRAAYALAKIADPLTPTYVTLDVDKAPLREVLASIAKQAGVPVALAPQNARRGDSKITLHVSEEPLLDVFVRICEQADLFPWFENGGWVVGKGTGTWNRDHTTTQGVLSAYVEVAQRQTMIDYSNPPTHKSGLQLAAGTASEGKLVILGLENVRLTKCEDDQGRPVNLDIQVQQPRGFLLTTLAADPPKAIAAMEGVIDFVVGARQDRFEVQDLATAKNTKRVAGILRLTFEHCRETTGREWAVRCEIYRDARDDATWAQLKDGLRNQSPTVLDSRGRELEPIKSEIVTTGDDQFEIDYHFANKKDTGHGVPDRPTKLTWNVPTRPATVRVPFRFKNVPLP